MSTDMIKAWTQSILGIIVVVGSGILLATTNVDPELLVGVSGVVLGYFFGSAVSPAPFNRKG